MLNAESHSSPSRPILSTANPAYYPSPLTQLLSVPHRILGWENPPPPGDNGTNDTEPSVCSQFHQPQVVALWGPVGSEEGAAAPRSRQEPGAEEPSLRSPALQP